MTLSHRSSLLAIIGTVFLTVVLCGCASSKPQAFQLSFLPSTPQPVVITLEEPPRVASAHYGPAPSGNELPDLVRRAFAALPRPPEVDGLIVGAEDHFQNGKRLYAQGDISGARREFDRSLDVLLSAPDNLPDRQRLERKLDQLAESIYRYDLEGLGALTAQREVIYDKSPLDSILEMTFPSDPNLRPKVKEEIEATASQLPLEENDAVLSYIHYFSTERGRKILIAGLRRSGRYRALVQRILDNEGLPQELIYLAQIESGFLPRARSNKSAVGMWQFVQFRGRQYGLLQTPASDDRLDPEKATRAAARHLRDLYASFGDWYLAMAAYNCGPGCVERAVEHTGFADFWELRNRNVLPRETANYVPAIVALTIMAKNPKDYDLENLDFDQPVEYDSLGLDTPASLALLSDASSHTISEIQELNPSLLKPVAPVGYELRVPKGTSPAILAALDCVPPSHRAQWRIHRVAQGETLAEIAHRYSTPVASITAVNQRLQPPEAGDLLVIPVGHAPSPTTARPRLVATSHHTKAAPRRTAPAHRAAVANPEGAKLGSTYKTASLTPKRRSTAD
jgi:membrane-bound lytic murein transglycosylase D